MIRQYIDILIVYREDINENLQDIIAADKLGLSELKSHIYPLAGEVDIVMFKETKDAKESYLLKSRI